jgi:hypothetical protein
MIPTHQIKDRINLSEYNYCTKNECPNSFRNAPVKEPIHGQADQSSRSSLENLKWRKLDDLNAKRYCSQEMKIAVAE